MTRIIAGAHKGRRLVVPKGDKTRPTADRAREGLFSSLQSLIDLDGVNVLDLYAGSGALGLEAISRGAAHATLVEHEINAVNALHKNVALLDAPATVVDEDVTAFLKREPSSYQLVLVDPPYELSTDELDLQPWTEPGSVVVLERRTRGPEPQAPQGMQLERSRRYGEATLWYFARP